MIARQGSRSKWVVGVVALFALLLGVGALAVSTYAAAPGGFGVAAGGSAGGSGGGSAGRQDSASTCPTTYVISESIGAQIVAGTTLVAGSRCDDCLVDIALPFSYSLYGTPFTSAKVNSNGYLLFTGQTMVFANSCLPYTQFTNTLLPYWDDLVTNAGAGDGIFTSVSGSAPNRIFNIEWKAATFGSGAQPIDFEVRLYEGQDRFDYVYGAVINGGNSATVGVQQDAANSSTQYSCNTAVLSAGKLLTFTLSTPSCPAVTPTSTATTVPSATATELPAPIILGHATWDGRPEQPNAGQELPISLTLRLVSGGPYIDYPYQTTDASGYFTVTVTGLAHGVYYWRAEGPHYLANAGTIDFEGAPVTLLDTGTMRPGDANGDNLVNTQDFIIQRNTYNTACGDPGYREGADFNGDCAVNARDFTLLKNNFGARGAPPIGYP